MSRIFSKDDAEKIFAMAAERQQNDEMEAVEGLSLEDLEEAGRAAGIDPDYIRAAAADLLRPSRAPIQRTFMGVPVEMRQTSMIKTPIDSPTWKEIVRQAQHIFGKEGQSTETGLVREWTSVPKENQLPVRIIAEAEGTGTRITIERKTWPQAIGFGIGSIVNIAMGLLLIVTSLAGSSGDGDWIVGSILLGFGLLFGLGAAVGLRMVGKKQATQFEKMLRAIDQVVADINDNRELALSPASAEPLNVSLEDTDMDAVASISVARPKRSRT